jgi:thiol-disulfide isomerase/thioredoxin
MGEVSPSGHLRIGTSSEEHIMSMRVFRSLLCVGIGTGLASTALAADRVVFIEDYTAVWCGPCRGTGEALHNIQLKHPDRVVVHQIHSDDGFELVFGDQRYCRWGYCGGSYALPTVGICGKDRWVGTRTELFYQSQVDYWWTIPTDTVVKITAEKIADSAYNVHVDVSVEPGGAAKEMRVFLTVLIDQWPDTQWHHCNGLGMTSTADGRSYAYDTVSVSPGQTVRISKSLELNRIVQGRGVEWNPWDYRDNLRLAAWAEGPGEKYFDSNAEVYNAAMKHYPFDDKIVGDLNGDGKVDLSDLAILLADYGCTGGDCVGDVDGDGDTDLADLAALLGNYGYGT